MSITYNPHGSILTEGVTNQGTLIVYTYEGRHKFVITGEQNVAPILALLERYLVAVGFM